MPRVTLLKIRDENPSLDQRPFRITVERENEHSWFGTIHTTKNGTRIKGTIVIEFQKSLWSECSN